MRPVIPFAGFVTLYLYSVMGIASGSMPLPIMTVILFGSTAGMVGMYLRELHTPDDRRLPLPSSMECGQRLRVQALMYRTLLLLATAEMLVAWVKNP